MNYPLQPLSPIQRLGWLKHFRRVKCIKAFARFAAGTYYECETEIVKVEHRERRKRRDGITEPVTLTGSDLYIRVTDGHGESHRFLAAPQAVHAIIHNHLFFVEHFQVPDIPNLALVRSKEFKELKQRLRALES